MTVSIMTARICDAKKTTMQAVDMQFVVLYVSPDLNQPRMGYRREMTLYCSIQNLHECKYEGVVSRSVVFPQTARSLNRYDR